MAAPDRNLPPDAQAWGRYIEKRVAEIAKRVGIVTTNAKALSAQSSGIARDAAATAARVSQVEEAQTAIVEEVVGKDKSAWVPRTPPNPQHNHHWYDVANGNVLKIYTDFGNIERINYVRNPSFREGTNGWTALGGELATTPDGKGHISGTTDGAAAIVETQGRAVVIDVPATVDDGSGEGAGEAGQVGALWTASAEVELVQSSLTATATLEVIGPDDEPVSTSGPVILEYGTPVRITARPLPGSEGTMSTVRVALTVVNENEPGFEVTVDEVILEAADYGEDEEQQFFDGSMPGVLWQGTPNLSTSWWDGTPRWIEAQDEKLKDEVLGVSEQIRADLDQATTDLATAAAWIDNTGVELETRLQNAEGALGQAEQRLIDAETTLGAAFPSGVFDVEDRFASTLQNTLVQYAVNSSETVPPTSGWTAETPTRTPGTFVWFRTVLTYANGNTSTSAPALLTGNTGAPGNPGAPGTGVTDTAITYAQSTSGTTAPTSGWVASPPAPVAGQYVWTRTVWTYSDGTTKTAYSVGKIGETGAKGDKGDRGSDGLAGADGVGLASTAITYARSTSGTVAPTTGWTTTVPSPIKGQYLWTRTVWTYTDGSTETGYTTSYWATDGAKGDDGIAGKDGVGIVGTTITYAQSTSGTVAPTTGWTAQPPAPVAGQYIWTRTVWAYSDNTTETGYSVGKIGDTGAKGDAGDKGDQGVSVASVTPYYRAVAAGSAAPAMPTGASPSGWSTTEPAYNEANDLYRTEQVTYSNGQIVYTPVTKIASYEGIKDAREAARRAQEEADKKADLNWVLSRGTDLVTNGTGYMGDNTNFSRFNYDPSDAPIGSTGSFVVKDSRIMGTATSGADEYIPVDPAKKYILSGYLRQQTPGIRSTAYIGLVPIDADGLAVMPHHWSYEPTSLTTLAAPLNPGDTTVTLASGVGWDIRQYNTFAVADYVDGNGRVWPQGTYTRWTNNYGAINGNVITLNSPWTGPALAVGHKVHRSFPGGNYMYAAAAGVTVPEEWTRYTSSVITGVKNGVAYGAVSANTEFPAGTAMVRPLVWLNYSGDAGGYQAISGLSFSDATAALVEAEAAKQAANAAHEAAGAAQNAADAAIVSANGKTAVLHDTEPPSGTANPDDIWWQHESDSNGDPTGTVIGQWRWATAPAFDANIYNTTTPYLRVEPLGGGEFRFTALFDGPITRWSVGGSSSLGDGRSLTHTVTSTGTLWVRYYDGSETHQQGTFDVTAAMLAAGQWVKEDVGSEAIANLDVGKLTVGTAAVSLGVFEKIVAERSHLIEADIGKLKATTALVDTGVISELWTKVVRSRRITTDMMIVGGSNLLADPRFSDATLTEGRRSRSAGSVVADGINTTNYFFFLPGTTLDDIKQYAIPVQPGETYRIEIPVTLTSMLSTTARVETFTETGVRTLRSVPLADATYENNVLGYNYTIPAGAVYMAPIIYRTTTFTVHPGATVRQKVSANLIVKGGVTAEHMNVVTEQTTGAKLSILEDGIRMWDAGNRGVYPNLSMTTSGGFLLMNKDGDSLLWIDPTTGTLRTQGAVMSNTVISAPQITGGTFTGSTFQTAETGKRWRLNGGGAANEINAWTDVASDVPGSIVVDRLSGIPMIELAPPVAADATGSTARVNIFGGTAAESSYILLGGPTSITGSLSVRDRAEFTNDLDVNGTIYGATLNSYTDRVSVLNDLVITSTKSLFVTNVGNSSGGSTISFGNNGLAQVSTIDGGGEASRAYFEQNFGRVRIPSVHSTTTTTAANVFVGSNGTMARSTSASRYKVAQEVVPGTQADALLDLDPKTWFDKGDAERYATYIDRCNAFGPQPNPEDLSAVAPLRRILGLIAEDVEAAGITEAVTYGDDGQVEGIAYDRLWTLLIPSVRKIRDENTQLKDRVERLECLVASLLAE